MKYLEVTDEERRLRARHDAAPPVLLRRVTTVALGATGVLVAAVLGWSAAGDAERISPAGAAATEVLVPAPSTETDWAEPAMRRTIGLATTPPAVPENAAIRPEAAETGAPPTAPPPPQPEPEPVPVPSLDPDRATVPSVRQGDPCAEAGDIGVTRSGDAAVCTPSPGNGRTRWRHV